MKTRKCWFCKKPQNADTFYQIAKGKNYQHTYICNRCHAYYKKGCTLNLITRRWHDESKVRKVYKYPKKPKVYFQDKTKDIVDMQVRKTTLSWSNILDYFE